MGSLRKDILKVRSRSRSSSRTRTRFDRQIITRMNSSKDDIRYKELKEKRLKSKIIKETKAQEVDDPNKALVSKVVNIGKEFSGMELDSNIDVSKPEIGLSESEGERQLFQQEFVNDIDFGEYDQADVDAVNDLDSDDKAKVEVSPENSTLENGDDSIKSNSSKLQVIEYQFDDIDLIKDIDRVKVKRNLNEEFRKPGEEDGEEASTLNAVDSKAEPILIKKDLQRKSVPVDEGSKVIASTIKPVNTAAVGDIEKTIEEIDKTATEKPRERNLEAKIKALTDQAKKNCLIIIEKPDKSDGDAVAKNSEDTQVNDKSDVVGVVKQSELIETDDPDGKKFKCVTCPKMFKSKSVLNNHTIVHSGEKPFKCDQCSYACNQKGNLKVHTTRKHGT